MAGTEKQEKSKPKGCMGYAGQHHHYQRIEDRSITAATLAQPWIPAESPNRPIRYFCIQCGDVVTVK